MYACSFEIHASGRWELRTIRRRAIVQQLLTVIKDI